MENKKDVFDRGKEIGVQPPSDTHSNDNTILEQLQDAENQILFGQFTQNNYSLEENLQKLVVNYRELAKQGNPEAQYKYGMFLRQGIGVKKNFRETLKYLKLSAK